MTKRLTASYKYIHPETGRLFKIERNLTLWKWKQLDYIIFRPEEYKQKSYFTRRECKQEIEKLYGPIIALSTNKKNKK